MTYTKTQLIGALVATLGMVLIGVSIGDGLIWLWKHGNHGSATFFGGLFAFGLGIVMFFCGDDD